MATVVKVVTGVVVAAKTWEMLDPAGTVTVGGTATIAGLALERVTSPPPGGAWPSNDAVLDETTAPPTTPLEARVTCEMEAGKTLRFAVFVTPR